MIIKPTEEFIDTICAFLGYDKNEFVSTLEKLRSKNWQRWGGGTVEVAVGEILYVVTALQKPKRVFEAGTAWGYSTAHIAEALREFGDERFFLSADVVESQLTTAHQYLAEKGLTVQTECKSSELPRDLDNLDMVFVDSSHTYEGTKREWAWMYPLLFKNNGIALFHDAFTVEYKVKDLLEELRQKGHEVLILDTQTNTGLGIVKLAKDFITPETVELSEVEKWLHE
jgi:predicted O-methyltransferase YrrM